MMRRISMLLIALVLLSTASCFKGQKLDTYYIWRELSQLLAEEGKGHVRGKSFIKKGKCLILTVQTSFSDFAEGETEAMCRTFLDFLLSSRLSAKTKLTVRDSVYSARVIMLGQHMDGTSFKCGCYMSRPIGDGKRIAEWEPEKAHIESAPPLMVSKPRTPKPPPRRILIEDTPQAQSREAQAQPTLAKSPPKRKLVDKDEVLEIELLKLYQTSRSHAAMDVRFINSSSNDIKYWTIDVEVYDKSGKYLACGGGMVSYLRAGQSKVEEIIFLDTQASRIGAWKATLGAIVGHSGSREDRKYSMKVRD